MASESKLFQPMQVGDLKLSHRIVMAPLTRSRAGATTHIPSDMAVEYYAQRSSPGTLLISEATFIAPQAGGGPFIPGIWNEEQIAIWRKVTDAVHARGGFIFCQLWALGRAARADVLKAEDPSFPYVSASDIPVPLPPSTEVTSPLGHIKNRPRPLTVPEIHEYAQLYAQAASNAIKSGFDGIEVHGANGYLPDQFLQDVTNKRTDEYGGSIENRCRFGLELLDAVVKAIGEKRTSIRISPWEIYHGMRMAEPRPTFSHFVRTIRERWPGFAYIHVTEARITATEDREAPPDQNNDFIREIWAPKPLISAGGYTRDLAMEAADKKDDIIAFGRMFISNPDLPLRLMKNIPLAKYDRATFYTQGKEGYIDYPAAEDV